MFNLCSDSPIQGSVHLEGPGNWSENQWNMKTVWKLSQEGTKTSTAEFIVIVIFYLRL